MSPTIILVAVNPSLDDVDPPFRGELVRNFLYLRCAENFVVTVWLLICMSMGYQLLLSWTVLSAFVLVLTAAVWGSRIMMIRTRGVLLQNGKLVQVVRRDFPL